MYNKPYVVSQYALHLRGWIKKFLQFGFILKYYIINLKLIMRILQNSLHQHLYIFATFYANFQKTYNIPLVEYYQQLPEQLRMKQ